MENKIGKDGKLGEDNTIQGVFDGQHMVSDDGRIFPVPANYASKSKLVEGDRLKLSMEGGMMTYKQTSLVPRIILNGKSGLISDRIVVICGDNIYQILEATIKFFDIKAGEEVLIVVPEDGKAEWAAVEAVIRKKV